jgi:HEAT repeat protein
MAEGAIPFAQRVRDPRREARLAVIAEALLPGVAVPPPADVAPLLDDSDPTVRELAAVLLGQIGAPAIAALSRALEEKQPLSVRIFAASGLARAGSAAAPAIEGLGKCLGASDETLRASAGFALSRIGAAALAVLRRGLAAEVSAVPSARAIGWMGREGAPAADDLKRLAASGRGSARVAAWSALVAVTGDPSRGLPQLTEVAGGKDPALRVEAVERIGELREHGRGAAPALRSLLDDTAAPVRAAAALALARVGSLEPETRIALARRLSDSDGQVRGRAALALEKFGSSAAAALPALRALAADPDIQIATVAAAAVRSIEGPSR